LTLHVQDELLLVLIALEDKLLGVGFIGARSEHDIDCLLLARHKHATVRPDMEAFRLLLVTGAAFFHDDLFFLVLVVPLTHDVLVVFNPDLDRLASVDADTVKIDQFSRHLDLRDCQVGNEFNRVLRAILDVNWDQVLGLSQLLLVLPRCHNSLEQHGLVRHHLLGLVRLDGNARVVEQLLVEVKTDRDLAAVGKPE